MEQRSTILAVDDNSVNLVMLSAMLSREYNVITISDGSKVEREAEEKFPDLVLLDVIMPGKDGLSICADLKRNPRTQTIPVIMVTAKNSSEDIAHGLEVGADDYLCKPFGTAELMFRIKRRINAAKPNLDFQRRIQQLEIERDNALALKNNYEKIINNSSECIALCDVSGRVLTLTHKASEYFGIESVDNLPQITSLAKSIDERNALSMIINATNSGKGATSLTAVSSQGEDSHLVEFCASPIRDLDGNISQIVIKIKNAVHDLDGESSNVEKILLKQEKEIAGFLKYNVNGILMIGENLKVLRYNRRFLEIFGISQDINYKGELIDTIFSVNNLEDIKALIDSVKNPPLMETALLHVTTPMGGKFYIEASVSKISTPNSETILLFFTDVTRLRNMDRAVLSAAVAAEERERTHLAQEIHDGLGATLSSINIYLNLIISGGADIDEIFTTLRLTKELVGNAIEAVKDIANNLHPVILTRFGLAATINNIIESLESSHLIKFNFEYSKFLPINDKDAELSLYRIINELINNTMKYASAKNVYITMETNDNTLRIVYADDGKGFVLEDTLSSPKAGMGISNIMGRTKALNGICEFQTTPGNGMEVIIEIPIK